MKLSHYPGDRLIFLEQPEGTDFFSRRFVKINLSPGFKKEK